MTESSLNHAETAQIDYVKFRHDITEFMLANCPDDLRKKVCSTQKIGRETCDEEKTAALPLLCGCPLMVQK